MVTIQDAVQYVNGVACTTQKVWCKSTDVKPTEGIGNGSQLREMDTGKDYAFDAESGEWLEQPEEGGGGGGGGGADAIIRENRDESSEQAISSYALFSGSYNDLLTKLQARQPIKVALERSIDYGNNEFTLVATEATSANVNYYEGSYHEIDLFFVSQSFGSVAPIQVDLYILPDGTVTDRLD